MTKKLFIIFILQYFRISEYFLILPSELTKESKRILKYCEIKIINAYMYIVIAIWLPLDQLWAIIEGNATLARF